MSLPHWLHSTGKKSVLNVSYLFKEILYCSSCDCEEENKNIIEIKILIL